VGLDGGLRDIQLVGNLFVEQAIADHRQHTVLLRRELGNLARQRLFLRIQRNRCAAHAGRKPRVAIEHGIDGLADLFDIG
jgi:hypothetical protein